MEVIAIKKFYFYIVGAVVGLANGLFGSGGGIIAVPMLQKGGIETKKSHATSLAIMLPLSIISAAIYGISGKFELKDALLYMPLGLLGAIIGGFLLKRISTIVLKRIFGGILVVSSIRLLLL
ncbi:MAG: sulfite exporter TauE/SafE family protein [Oscillospiraceae bacterium]